jgi:hypothetical protein
VIFFHSDSYKEDVLVLRWPDDPKEQGIFLDDASNPNFDVQISTVEPGVQIESLFAEEKFDKYRRK